MLSIDKINVYYSDAQALREVSLNIKDGKVFALLGRNGAGKTTLLKSCIGLLPVRSGSIRFNGRDITNMKPYRISKLGCGYVPQERCVFPPLSVVEHLSLAVTNCFRPNSLSAALSDTVGMFPDLADRMSCRGDMLSGGEAQMLEIAMALARKPSLLLLDEPSQGLSAINIRKLITVLQSLAAQTTIFLSEQNIQVASELSDNLAVIRDGTIVYEGSKDDIKRSGNEILKKYILS